MLDATESLYGYLIGTEYSNLNDMLRMSEVNEVDHQAMQYMLTEGVVDRAGFDEKIARETGTLLRGFEPVMIFDESGFAKKQGFDWRCSTMEWSSVHGG